MHKISSKEVVTFAFCLCTFLFPGFGYDVILETSKGSSILAVVVGFILGFIPIFIMLYISNNLNNKNIFEFNKEKFKIFGQIINLLLVICAILICAISSWTIINFVISQFLTRSSYYFFAIVFFIIIAYSVTKGLEVMGRTNLILSFFFLIVVIFSWIFLIPLVEIENLFPLVDSTISNFSKSSIIYSLLSAVPIFMILAIRKSSIVDQKKYKKNIILSYILGGILLIGFLFLILGILGFDVAYVLAYPEYTIFKKIKAFNFIERVENIVAVTLFISFFGAFSYMLFFIKEWFNTTFKIKKEKTTNIFIYVVSLIIPILSIMFFKKVHSHYFYSYFPIVTAIMFAIFLFIFGTILVKNIFKRKS